MSNALISGPPLSQQRVDIHPTAKVHSSAIIEKGARIGESVEIGPWTLIEANVQIEAGSRIYPHVVVRGPTKIGRNNVIFQFCSVGEACQDMKYAGEPTRLEIGDNNIIREGCTLHRGTIQDEGLTSIGSHNLLMAYVHIAHDCRIGNNCIMANNVSLAGHVKIEDSAILGGYTAIHQFCRISAYSMCAARSAIFKDVPAFVMASGTPAKPYGMNYEGMRRRGYSSDLVSKLRKCYKIIYRQGLKIAEAIDRLESMESCPELQILINSLKSSTRGIVR